MTDELEGLDREDGAKPDVSPLRSAAQGMREARVPQPKAGATATLEVDGTDEGEEQSERDGEQQDGAEGSDEGAEGGEGRTGDEAEGEEAEGEEGAEGAEGAAKGQSLDIPAEELDAKNGGTRPVTLVLDGLTQEFRDAIQHHINRSQTLDGVSAERDALEERVDRHENLTAFVEHAIKENDAGVMLWLEVQKPELGQAFARSWMERHPLEAVKILTDDLKVDGADPEKLTLRARDAQRQAQDRLKDAIGSVTSQREMARYTRRAERVVGETMGGMKLNEADQKLFLKLAQAHLTNHWRDREAEGQNPILSGKELKDALQPIVEKFGGDRSKATRTQRVATGKTEKSAKQLEADGDLKGAAKKTRQEWEEKLRRSKGHRAAGAGSAGITSYLRAGGMKKVKVDPVKGPLVSTIRAMKSGKL